MSLNILRIATRNSPLAVWQAEHVARCLQDVHPGLKIELVGISTLGDKILDSPLAKVGGKGLFVKELEQGLLADRADIAVHSMKDVPVELPDGLIVPVIMTREDPRDAFVSATYAHPDLMPAGARVGTSSLRRQCQLQERYPELIIRPLRGNVGTRLAKLDAGEYDAVVLAAAGLMRLQMAARISCRLAPEFCLPAIGQGAIGIECRQDDARVREMIDTLDDPLTHACVDAERAMNVRLQGGCQVPIAGYAVWEGERLWLRGLVGDPDGRRVVRGEIRGPGGEARRLGGVLAEELLGRGADEILRRVYGAVTDRL